MVITFLPSNKKVHIEEGTSLYEAAVNAGIDTDGVCSGRKTCGKCKVLVTRGNDRIFSAEETQSLTEEEKERGIRLACCFYPASDTCAIVEERKRQTGGRCEGMPGKDMAESGSWGIMVDLGTTNLEGVLYDRKKRTALKVRGIPNPQRIYGGDVVSRITYAIESSQNALKLKEAVKEAANTLIKELAAEQGISPYQVEEVVMAGNTTMTSLFLGRSVKGLSRAPFQSESYAGSRLNSWEAGIAINTGGYVYVLPGISGHVGGDTLACILSTKLYKEERKVLLLDIGTNGEIVLCDGKRLIACSVAAGPAFEGGNISCGMRAEQGAVTAVRYRDSRFEVQFIGDENEGAYPSGICGSGLIECVYELYENNKIDETGRLLGKAGEENRIVIWSEGKRELSLTQKDIREYQLAQGAVRAGVAILLEKAGLRAEELDKIYLAGNFGRNLSVGKAIRIGLLPLVNENIVEYIGNGVLTGGAKILTEEISIQEAEEISRNTEHIELALEPAFEEQFVKAMSFPPKDKDMEY